ncbi:ATP synthase subunit delta, mitochondrial [Drosophila subobscura]|uniref:ATP synthase subunit delta, mitochondrial n=1 Tax=Drosophila subobscura TaxID=7241 RepID=UPI00155A887B|nr:ATP synthase subunit delta, mitochondrial [Drosophila subobscura]XP_034666118.1 ATP synthase subunit delta, mitochondrial [Drosophila subobscura]
MSFVKNARFLAARGARLAQSRAYSDEMKLTFAAANKTFYDATVVRQIDVPSFSGAFGILAKHVPTLAVLKPGVVQVVENDGKTTKYFVSSGSVTVNEDSSVQVLAEEAHNIADIDISEARQLLSKYQSQLSSAGDDKAKAEAAIAVEVAEALVKAAE